MAINFTNIGLAQPSTVTHRVRTVQIPMGSTNEQQELLSLADPESSAGVLRVVDVAPDSTHFGAVVRQVGYVAPSTTINVSSLAGLVSVNLQSTASVRVTQSSAADLNVTVAGYSTTMNVSSLAGVVQTRLQDSSGVAVIASTSQPPAGANGLAVRQAFGTLLSTTVVITSSNSTALYDLVSSAANVGHKVFAYFVASTHTTPSTLVFVSSNGADKWAVAFGSGSSGVTGANLSVSPPGWLFQSAANEALRCRIENVSTQVLARVSFSYFSEA